MHNNYEIIYSNKVENKLDKFIEYVWDTCRYKDSWLYDEEIIVNSFVSDIKLFVRDLRKSIEEKIHSWLFWQIEESSKTYKETKLVIFIRSYNITCKCRKWLKEETVTIEDIFIRN